MKHERYSEDFKKSAVKKMLNRGQRHITTISEEHGISQATLYHWKKEFANVIDMKKTPH